MPKIALFVAKKSGNFIMQKSRLWSHFVALLATNRLIWSPCWKSKVKIGFWIWIVNPVLSFQSKSWHDYFIKKLRFYSASWFNNEAKLLFIKIFKQLIYQLGCKLIRVVSRDFQSFIIKLGHLIYAERARIETPCVCYS